jgi:hypothetical protein
MECIANLIPTVPGHEIMTLSEFKNLLSAHPEKLIRFVLPNGKSIPAHYHITEVGHVKKDFIDCGGTIRSASACVLQAWVATNDEDHRLEAGKLGAILALADKVLPIAGLPVELEYEAPVISQFSVLDGKIDSGEIVFRLANKHTDCLAKESCGLDGGPCGTGEEDCCVSEEAVPEAQGKSGCC